MDYTTSFNTKLSPKNEQRFDNWMKGESKRRGRNMSRDLTNYDLRGYWLNGGYKDTSGKGHMTDKYKKPNHPTFSTESKYNGKPDGKGGKYQGGIWAKNSFTPSTYMLNHTINADNLRRYFKKIEPGVQLILPAPGLGAIRRARTQ